MRNTQITDSQPSLAKTSRVSATFAKPYSPRILWAEYFFSKPAPVKRPARKSKRPTDARLDAPLLLIDRTPDLLVSNQPRSQSCRKPECSARLVMAASQEAGMA